MNVAALRNFSTMVVRYALSGFAGIGANLVVFSFLVLLLDVWYILAAMAGFVAAYVVTFLLHKYWTFKNLAPDLFYKQSVVYFFSAVATLVVNTLFLFVLVDYVLLHPVLAQFASLLFAAAFSFLFTTQITFHANSYRLHRFTGLFNFGLGSALQTHRRWLVGLALLALLLVGLRLTLLPLSFTSDAVSYVATAELLWGNTDAVVYGERILKPLAPYVIGLLAATGLSFEQGLLVQAGLLYFFLIGAVFWFGMELFRRPDYAGVLAVVVMTSYPILRYGLDYFTETGVWACYFAALAATLRWQREPAYRWVVLASAFFLAGLLWKEYIVLAGLFFLLVVLGHQALSWKEKVFTLLQAACLVLIPWGMWQYAVFLMYDYTYLDWLAVGQASGAYAAEYTFFKVTKTLFALLFAGWLLVAFGLYHWRSMARTARHTVLLLLVPSLGFLLWGYVSSRLFFSLVPVLAPLAVVGFMSLPNRRWKVAVVFMIGVCNSVLIAFAFDPNVRALLNTVTNAS